jgi:hypothetical protein
VIGLDYHERLEAVDMYLVQRRLQHYYIIHVWKILEGFLMNVNHKIKPAYNPQTRRTFKYKIAYIMGDTGIQTKQFITFAVWGSRTIL